VVAALYALLSGPDGAERDWDAVRALFLPEAWLHSELIFPNGTIHSRTWTVDVFLHEAAEEYASAGGFWEREVARRVEEFGDIAHAWSTYEARVGNPDSPPAVRGINSIQLLRRGARWWITGLVFQIERPPAAPTPAQYLTAPSPQRVPNSTA
jgi:hypothetical protein